MLEASMETEFKIPTHPASETLFSRHAMTTLLATSRVGEVAGRGGARTSRTLHSPPGAAIGRSSSPGQAIAGGLSHSPGKCSSVRADSTSPGHSPLTPKTCTSPSPPATASVSPADRLPHTKLSRTDSGQALGSPGKTQTAFACRAGKGSSSSSSSSSGSSSVCGSSPSTSLLNPAPQSSPTASRTPADSSLHTQDIFSQPRAMFDSDSKEVQSFQQPFYFETDHLALKTNRDYQTLLKTVTLLEAQRIKALQDLDKLLEGQDKALQSPIAFVQKLQNRENLGLPGPQKVAQIPQIPWDNYTGSMAVDQKHKHKHMTRHNRPVDIVSQSSSTAKATSAVTMTTQDKQGSTRDNPHTVTSTSVKVEGGGYAATETQEQDSSRQQNSSRTENFNKAWTIEEQRQLEQLLVEYPPEEVEARRWEKIANALGNRTMLQVASRVQKYFIKLAKARLPIPGRMPNLSAYTRKGYNHRHQRHNRHYSPYSTFLASHEPPVHMPDDDPMDDQGFSFHPGYQAPVDHGDNAWTQEEVSDEESVPIELRATEEYRQLLRLKRMRKTKLKEEQGAHTLHTGFKCDSCNCDPIVGTRWHCTECPEEVSVDFCSDCIDMNYENDMHSSTHHLEPIQLAPSALPHIDKDYTKFSTSGYNYLDPNYMPAS